MIDFIFTVVVEVAKCLAPPLARRCDYLRNHKTNFDKLDQEVGRLKIAREKVQHKVDTAVLKDIEKIKPEVEEWQTNVKAIIADAEKLIQEKRNNRGFCPNLMTRHKQSKEASAKVEVIVGLLQERFDKVSDPTPPPEIWLTSTGYYEAFGSRNTTLKQIIDALNDSNIHMVGVYGMGGIGKTTLAKEVGRQVKKQNLFDEVVFAEVTKTPEIKKIQDQIADKLGLKFNNETERANKLYQRLKNEKKILVILDNIWEELDLETIGIPSGAPGGGCKLLLTTRDQLVLRKMGCTFVQIGILNEEEAWNLFKKIAHDNIENQELKSLAKDVAKQCGGLPIAIVTVGKALRGKKRESQWKVALGQLKSRSPEKFEGEYGNAYKSIELSYNFLREELKKLFLVCSSINPDGSILDLLKYGIGLDILFQGTFTIEEARDKVDALIHELKDSSLLLDGQNSQWFSIHDFVHEVAVSIANRHENVFYVKNDTKWEWPCSDNYRRIFITEDIISKLPSELECPQLESLCMMNENRRGYGCNHVKIPEKFFNRTIELKVLDLVGMRFLSLSSSLHLLVNLQTLSLDYCQFEDVAVIGEMKKLKILSLRSSNIRQLPSEIGQLGQLRLLDLSDCWELKAIASNVISRLSRLEELYMRGCDGVQWEVKGMNVESGHACLEELCHSSQLTTLEIDIEDDRVLPTDFFSKKLERYAISIGQGWDLLHGWDWDFMYHVERTSRRMLKLKLKSSICLKEAQNIKNAEALFLDEWQGEKDDLLSELGRDGFSQLKHLGLKNNHQFRCIVDSMSLAARDAFPALESLVLSNLSNLEKICRGQFTTEISFSQLSRLTLRDLPQLRSFYSGASENNQEELTSSEGLSNEIVLETGSDIPTALFNGKAVFPKLEVLKLKNMNVEKIWDNHLLTMASPCQNMTRLIVDNCHKLKYLFSYSTVKSLEQLQHLEISNCSVLKEIVEDRGGAETGTCEFVFPQVTYIKLWELPELTTFSSRTHTSKWPILKKLEIGDCDKVNVLCFQYNAESQFHISRPQSLFVGKEVVFPKLEVLELRDMNVEDIWHGQHLTVASSTCPNLTSLIVDSCQKLKYLFSYPVAKSLEQLQHLEISNCSVLKEIVGDRGGAEPATCDCGFVFPRVSFLKLWRLPELTAFYPRTSTSEWPTLMHLEIGYCDKVNVFSYEYSEQSHFDILTPQSLFLAQKINPNLEELTLGGKNITMMWQAQFPKNHFSKLKVILRDDESTNIPLPIPKNMEKLCFSYSWYKEIFSYGKNENYDGTPTQLKVLEMKNLFALKNLWKQDSNLDSLLQNLEILKVEYCDKLMNVVPSSASFPNLTTLEVSCCYGLLNLITSSTAKSLKQLREMKISYGGLLIEVVAKEEDLVKDEIVFNKLKSLSLNDLGSLISFCSGNHTFVFPSLEELIINRCPKMKNFSGGVITAPMLQKVRLSEGDMKGQWDGDLKSTIQNLHKAEVNFNSEKLILSGDDIRMAWQGQFPEHDSSGVKVLEIIKDESANIPLGILERFSNLEVLILKGSSYKEIFSSERGHKHGGTVPHIKRLELRGLFDLKQMWQQDSQLNSVLQNLESLCVGYCHSLINLMPNSASFENLTSLFVWNCDGLRNLVTYSTAKSLVRLEFLYIGNCEMMIEIVENREDEARDDEIHFNSLRDLRLDHLDSLSSFCSGNYSFNFPALKELTIVNCLKMKVFSEGVLNTPKLQEVKHGWGDEACWDGDLNTTIEQLHKKRNVQICVEDWGEASTQPPV